MIPAFLLTEALSKLMSIQIVLYVLMTSSHAWGMFVGVYLEIEKIVFVQNGGIGILYGDIYPVIKTKITPN